MVASAAIDPAYDPTSLREQAYPDGTNLRARMGIYAFQQPRVDWWAEVMAQTTWAPGHRVLDVGCGPGEYLKRMPAGVRRTGLDLSPGMAAEAAAGAACPTLVGDAAALPARAASFDRVLAAHMLYHVPSIPAAVAELRRVLVDGGVALVVTNGADHLGGFSALIAAALDVPEWFRSFRRFSLDNAEDYLRASFDDVVLVDHRGDLVVDQVDPVVAYVASARSNVEPQLPPGLGWDDAMDRVRAAVTRTVERDGAFRSVTHSGVLRCR